MLFAEGLIDLISSLDSQKQSAIVIIAIGCLTGIVISLGIAMTAMITSLVNTMHRRSGEQQLKREMLSMGLSAEEIERVIESAPPPEDGFDRMLANWGSKKKRDAN